MSDLESKAEFIEQYFCEIEYYYNTHERVKTSIDKSEMYNYINNSLIETLSFDYNKSSANWCRASSVGKPAVYTALNKVAHEKGVVANTESSYNLEMMFTFGLVSEAFFIKLGEMARWWTIRETQTEINYNGICGHIDCVVTLPNSLGDIVLELKCISPNYYRTFSKEQDDDRGYYTQLALYSECLGIPAYWLLYDKGTGQIKFVPLKKTDANLRLARASLIYNACLDLKSPEEIANAVSFPPSVEEVYRRSPTGYFVVPPSLKYSDLRFIGYEIESFNNGYGKLTEYVIRELSNEEVAYNWVSYFQGLKPRER